MAGQKGRSGRPAKPTDTLKKGGGFRTARHKDRADVLVSPAKLLPPGHLGEVGRKAWERIVAALPDALLTDLDPDSLAAYCDCLEVYHAIRPVYLADPIDKDTRISFFAALDHLDKLGRQFGWSPQSRASLQIPGGNDETDSNFDALLSRMSGRN